MVEQSARLSACLCRTESFTTMAETINTYDQIVVTTWRKHLKRVNNHPTFDEDSYPHDDTDR